MNDGAAAVLVVHPDDAGRAALCRDLAALGHRVRDAAEGDRAFILATTEPADLVLVDTRVPPRGGADLLRRLRAVAGGRELPVLILATPDELAPVTACLALGADDYLVAPFLPALVGTRLASCLERARLRRRQATDVARLERERRRSDDLLHAVIPLGAALLAEKDFDRLLETILCKAKELCNADGGTLYLRGDDDGLRFVMVRNDSLGIAMGGTSGRAIPFAPLPLRDAETGGANRRNVATYAALTGETVNVPDAYDADGFDFSGTKRFDREIGYRSTSFLTVPLKGHGGAVIGVLQLINAQDAETGAVVPFDAHGLQPLVESLSLLAAAALEAYAREESLKRQIQRLHIQIDETQKARQVAEIADTDYFQELQRKVRALRRRD